MIVRTLDRVDVHMDIETANNIKPKKGISLYSILKNGGCLCDGGKIDKSKFLGRDGLGRRFSVGSGYKNRLEGGEIEVPSLFANEAYQDPNSRGSLEGYEPVKDLSGSQVAVYRRTEAHGDNTSPETVLAFKGTSDLHDIIPDIGVAFNKLDKTTHFSNSKKKLDDAIKRYGKDNMHLIGHSLGASVASKLGEAYDIPVTGYNTGSSPIQVRHDLIKNVKCRFFNTPDCKALRKQTHHVNIADPVSISNIASVSKVKYHLPGKNPHALASHIRREQKAS